MGKIKYTKEVLIRIIKQKAGELKCLPRTKDVVHIYGTIYARFGGLKEAIKAAGLPWDTYGKKQYSDEDLLEILKKRSIELNRTPRVIDVSQGATIIKRFGGMKQALKSAGISLLSLHPDHRYSCLGCLGDFKNHRRTSCSH